MAAPPPPFGLLLRDYRLAAGLTQEQLAERAGLSARGISNLERGVRRLPYRHTVWQLADALGLNAAQRADFEDTGRASRGPVPDVAITPAAPIEGTPHQPLIGRVAERAVLDRHLRGLGPPVVLLAGEPGIGKTRLLQEAVGSGQRSGRVVLEGECQRWSRNEPYAPIVEAMESFIQGLDAATVQDALEGCGWLTHLLPELAPLVPTPLPAGTLSSEQERRLVFNAVKRFLSRVSGPAGVLLVLDDLQWAGSDALDLLGALVRSPEPSDVRVLGAYRDTEVAVQSPLHILLADLVHAGLVDQIALTGLSDHESALVLGQLLPGGGTSCTKGIVRRAGGVPFFLVSWAQGVQAETLHAQLPDALPWDLTESLRQRLAALPPEAQTVLGVAAVMGREVTVPLLLAATDLTEDVLVTALETSCGARLLEEAGNNYRFVHDVILEVVEAELSTARRALFHRRIAEALERQDTKAPVELLTYHYTRSGIQGKALEYLERAGDDAATRYAHGAAEEHYRELLERLDGLGRPRDVIRVQEKLGEALFGSGQYEAALPLLKHAHTAFRAAGDEVRVARVTARIAFAHALTGTADDGVAYLTPALKRVSGKTPPADLAGLYGALTDMFAASGQYAEWLTATERAAEVAWRNTDPRLWETAAWIPSDILQILTRVAVARPLSQAVLTQTGGTDDLEALADGCISRGYVYMVTGDFAAARRYADHSVAAAREIGDPERLAWRILSRTFIFCHIGAWREARVDLQEVETLLGHTEPPWYAAYPRYLLGHVLLVEGEWDTAIALTQEAIDLAERNGDLLAVRGASGVMAELELAQGKPEAASARLVALLARPRFQGYDATPLFPLLARSWLEQGEVERAAVMIEQTLARARSENLRVLLVETLRIAALIAIRQQRWADAQRDLEEGIALAREMPHPYAEARLLQVDGQRHAGQGEPDQAQMQLEAALAIFRRLGAVADARQAEQALPTLATGEHLMRGSMPPHQAFARS